MRAAIFSTEFSTSVENPLPERLSSGRGPGIIAFRGGHFKLFFRGKRGRARPERVGAAGDEKGPRTAGKRTEKRLQNGPDGGSGDVRKRVPFVALKKRIISGFRGIPLFGLARDIAPCPRAPETSVNGFPRLRRVPLPSRGPWIDIPAQPRDEFRGMGDEP
jgi:hypothetical protein